MPQNRSRGLVDPQLLALIDAFPQVNLTHDALAGLRTAWSLPHHVSSRGASAIAVSRATVPGLEGGPTVDVLIYRPPTPGDVLPCVVHMHGGGFVLGSAASLEPQHRAMAATLGCVIASIEYRLAPETPFPGAIEDCYAGLSWIAANARQIGIDPARIGLKGESAGGGLAASLAILARDRGGPDVAFQHLLYPMLDDRTCIRPLSAYAGAFFWTPENNRFGWTAMLGVQPGGHNISPYAAAARAEDLSGLPPAYLAVGALDLLAEETIDYARRLARGGTGVELHVYAGAFHGFELDLASDVSVRARRDSMDALSRFVGGA